MIKDHEAEIRAAAAAGLFMKEVAAQLGVQTPSLCVYAKKHGIKFVRPYMGQPAGALRPANERALAMKAAYETGQTLEQIAKPYGISRERVRQIITKHFGSLAKTCGASVVARANAEARRIAREAYCQKRWGCSWRQYKSLRALGKRLMNAGVSRERTPLGAYIAQRRNATMRGIGWELTLWQWWTIWQASGKWERRGRGRNAFVMCRKGDLGPYAEGNVFVAPCFQNSHDGSAIHGLPVGVTHGRGNRYRASSQLGPKQKRTYLGTFDTPEEAHLAYLRSLSTPAPRKAAS